MCSTELKFGSDCRKKWFARKYNSPFLKLNILSKKGFDIENPIDWDCGKCVICDFLLAVATLSSAKADRMSYFDFMIRKEH